MLITKTLRRRWGRRCLTLLTCLFCLGCTVTIAPVTSPAGGNPSPASHLLVNTAWYLTALGNTPTALPALTNAPVSLTFGADGLVYGNSGCHTYSGAYTLAGDRVVIERLTLTPVACADQALTRQDEQFLAALQTAVNFSLSEQRLAIWYGQGGGMLTFTAATAVTPTPIVTPLAALAAPAETATPFPLATVVSLPTAVALPPPPVVITNALTTPLLTPSAVPPLVPTVTLTNALPITTPAAASPIPLTFAPGLTTTVVASTINQGVTNAYLLQGQQGQPITVILTASTPPLGLRVSGQDGAVLKAAEDGVTTWTGQLPTTQTYRVDIVALGAPTSYTLQVTLLPVSP